MKLHPHGMGLLLLLGCVHPSTAVAQDFMVELPDPPAVTPRGLIATQEEKFLIDEAKNLLKEKSDIFRSADSFNLETEDGVDAKDLEKYAKWQKSLKKRSEQYLAVLAALKHLVLRRDALTRIGVVGTIKGEVWQVDLLGNKTQLKAGDPILLKGKITTGSGGHLKVQLQDKTVFTIGSDSKIIVDDFVCDPNSNLHKLTLEITKGAFRWVSGKDSRKNPSKVKCPVGILGIRGTEYLAEVSDEGATTITMFSGTIDWTMREGGATAVVEAGSQIVIPADGKTFAVKQLDAKALDERRKTLQGD